jgi:hypothetical protein
MDRLLAVGGTIVDDGIIRFEVSIVVSAVATTILLLTLLCQSKRGAYLIEALLWVQHTAFTCPLRTVIVTPISIWSPLAELPLPRAAASAAAAVHKTPQTPPPL